MQVVLVMFRGDGERRSFSVVRNMTVIGRREDCDLRIPLGDVSRKHCRLVRTDEGIRIEDLGSSNGTLVNGQKIKEAELNAGDAIAVGPVMFVVQIDGVPAEETMVSPHRAAAEAAVMADDSLANHAHAPTRIHEDELMVGGDAEYPLDELTIDEEVPLEELALEEAPLGEASLEGAPLEEAPLEEAHLEEAPLEEVAAAEVHEDELSLDEVPLEEASLEEVPLEEASLEAVPTELSDADELSLEEVALEEVPLEEIPGTATISGEAELEEVPMEEVPHTAASAAAPDGLEEMMLEEVPLEEVPLEEISAAPTGEGADELDWLEDEAPAAGATTAPPPPPPLPPSIAAEPAVSPGPEAEMELDLEEVTTESAHEPVGHDPAVHRAGSPPPAAEPAWEGDWDFVVDEADAGHHGDMHIDFEESHHGQPHA